MWPETENVIEKRYHDFVLNKYEVDARHIIFFYIMDYIPQNGAVNLADRIIPKAPFALFWGDNSAANSEIKRDQLLADYQQTYTTPAFIIATDSQGEEDHPQDIGYININKQTEFPLRAVLKEAIRKTLPGNL